MNHHRKDRKTAVYEREHDVWLTDYTGNTSECCATNACQMKLFDCMGSDDANRGLGHQCIREVCSFPLKKTWIND